jgi:phage shock protein A
MTDTIASRVTRVIGGSVHALLDAVENAAPEATMAQAIREVDQAIDEVRGELGRMEATKHLATSSLNKLNTHKESLAEQIEIAVAKGDESLARAGIAKQIDIDDQIPVLQRSLQDAIGRGNELEGYIAALLAKEGNGVGATGLHRRSRRRGRSARSECVGQHEPGQGRPCRIGLRARAHAPDRNCRCDVNGQCGRGQAAGAAGARPYAPDRRAPRGAEGSASQQRLAPP